MNSRKNREEVVTEVFIFKNKKEFTKILKVLGNLGLFLKKLLLEHRLFEKRAATRILSQLFSFYFPK